MDGSCEYNLRNLGPPHKTHPWDGVGAAIPAGDSDLDFRKRKLQLKLLMNRARNKCFRDGGGCRFLEIFTAGGPIAKRTEFRYLVPREN